VIEDGEVLKTRLLGRGPEHFELGERPPPDPGLGSNAHTRTVAAPQALKQLFAHILIQSVIRFRIPDDATERLAFAYSPLVETMQSLHVLADPEHHPLQHPWVRRMRTLPPALKHEIAAFSFLYGSYIPGPLALPVGTFLTFEEELARVRAFADERLLRFELTRPLYGGSIARDPGRLDDPSGKERSSGGRVSTVASVRSSSRLRSRRRASCSAASAP
jgi:Family of unknown function (DUF5937)